MTIGNVQSTVESSNYIYSAKRTTDTTTECADIRDTLEMKTGSLESGIIGLTMIPNSDYGVYARYAKESTPENPIVQVVKSYDDEITIYKVNINEVDPSNATMLEMFALLSYADDQGLTSNTSSFGSFQQLKTYAMNASQNGYCDEVSGWEDFLNKKLDWTTALENIGQDYLEAGLHQQYQNSQYLLRFLHEHIEEMQAKIEAGDVDNDPVFQIGASAYTEEEWDKLLEYVDEVEEEIQEAMELEQEKALEEAQEAIKAEAERVEEELREAEIKESDGVTQTESTTNTTEDIEEPSLIEESESALLTYEYTGCTYSNDNPEGKDWNYITWYTEEGMYCEDVNGHVGNNWMFFWEDEEQYNKVMEFIEQFPEDYNMRFACNQTFWNDFLNDEIDMEGFMEFLETTNNGVPNYGIGDAENMRIDREKVQWAKYFNQPGLFRPLTRIDEFGNPFPDKQYTDEQTGFCWYVNGDGEPYMLGNWREDFYRHCEKIGADPTKKFAELTGMLQYLPDGSYTYIGSNAISIKSTDGEKMVVKKDDMTYDMLMYMFDNLPETDNYFDLSYWEENMQIAKEAVPEEAFFKYEPPKDAEKVVIDPSDIIYQ